MNVLLLGEKARLLQPIIEKFGHSTCYADKKITQGNTLAVDFIISFGYKFIIPSQIIEVFAAKIINLHISYLPFNRGADPNLWSFLENTPKGVTIHLIDEKLDTGDILLQKNIDFSDDETLKTSYDKLIAEVTALFEKNVEIILEGHVKPVRQTGKGSFHYKADKDNYLLLSTEKGYDTPVWELKGKALPT